MLGLERRSTRGKFDAGARVPSQGVPVLDSVDRNPLSVLIQCLLNSSRCSFSCLTKYIPKMPQLRSITPGLSQIYHEGEIAF